MIPNALKMYPTGTFLSVDLEKNKIYLSSI
jgi:hypothetical protein